LVASLGKEPIVLCQDATRARATMKRLRAVLDREYAAIRDALWNSP
jgi:hypothetical protein